MDQSWKFFLNLWQYLNNKNLYFWLIDLVERCKIFNVKINSKKVKFLFRHRLIKFAIRGDLIFFSSFQWRLQLCQLWARRKRRYRVKMWRILPKALLGFVHGRVVEQIRQYTICSWVCFCHVGFAGSWVWFWRCRMAKCRWYWRKKPIKELLAWRNRTLQI